MKQSFLFLSNENPKRPIIVPQEYPILNNDSLLQEDIPQCISDPLPPVQPIAFQPLGDCEKSSYYALAKKGYSHNELLFLISHLISILTNRNTREHKKTNQEPPRKSTIDTPKPESFPPYGKIQTHKELMDTFKPFHSPKKNTLITDADIVNILEQAQDLMQNMAFDTTRVSESASCIRTSLDEINYIFEKIQHFYLVIKGSKL